MGYPIHENAFCAHYHTTYSTDQLPMNKFLNGMTSPLSGCADFNTPSPQPVIVAQKCLLKCATLHKTRLEA